MVAALTIANIVAHLLALASGLWVLRKFEPAMQQFSARKTFSIHAVLNSYIGRRVWIVSGTTFFSMVMLLLAFVSLGDSIQTDWRVILVEIYGAFITTVYHLDTIKDRRLRQ